MTDPPRYPDSNSDTGVRPDRGSSTGTPRWVTVVGIIVIVVVLLAVVMFLIGGGLGMGPGMHTP